MGQNITDIFLVILGFLVLGSWNFSWNLLQQVKLFWKLTLQRLGLIVENYMQRILTDTTVFVDIELYFRILFKLHDS